MHLGFSRRNIGRLVLLGWAVALAWLARREFSQQGAARVAERTTRLAPGSQYLAVYAGGRQIGQLNLAVDTTVDGVQVNEQFELDLPDGDSTRQLAQGTVYFLSRALRVRTFTRITFGVGPQDRIDAVMGADSILGLTSTEGVETVTGRVRWRVDPDAALPAALSYRAAFGGHLRVGDSFVLPLIEVGAGGTRPLRVRITADSLFTVADSAVWDSVAAQWTPAGGDTVRAWRLEHDAPGAPTISWVDRNGALLLEETAGGLRLVRSAFEVVYNNYRRSRAAERSSWRRAIPGIAALIGTGRVPDTTAPTRAFLVRGDSTAIIRGVPWRLEGGRQRLAGDTVMISRVTPPDTSAGGARAARDASDLAWVMPSQDRRTGAAVRQALAGARTSVDSARGLTLWVARQIATDPSLSAPGSALLTLRSGRGSADGKARLLAVLMRQNGIPARMATGLAVLPSGSYAHAWTEVWLGGWVAVDPSYGHFPASASLIRLALGDRSSPVNLLPLVGSARFLPIRPTR